MKHKLLLPLALLALLAAVPGARAAEPAPSGFLGVSPQGNTGDVDFALMERAGVKSVRLPLYWDSVERQNPSLRAPDWSSFDAAVGSAAEHGIRVLPFVWGTPSWVAPLPRVEPINTAWERRNWMAFLRGVVSRYGPYGSFWSDHLDIPYMPIHRWEIWNEENIVTFSNQPNPDRFARLMKISARALRTSDPGAQALLGGLFGRPLQVPPNVPSTPYLDRVYSVPGARRAIDGVALHPYLAHSYGLGPLIIGLRGVLRRHGAGATPLYVTELGWGSDSGPSRWEQGDYGQAADLDESVGLLDRHRLSWRIGGVYWFSWMDVRGSNCQFCDSAGLLTTSSEAKPSWYRFNAWTGGDADSVPRALIAGQ